MKQDRMARVNRLIQTTLAEMLPGLIKDPRVTQREIIAVNAVQTTRDLRHAKVFLSISGDLSDREDALSGLRSARGILRQELGRRVRLHYVPELHFLLDQTAERAARVEQLLQEIASERADDE